MTKIKERIKKSLFAFFKDEIMNEFTIIENAKPFNSMFRSETVEAYICESRVDMQEFATDFNYSTDRRGEVFPYSQDPEMLFENARSKAQKILWDEFCKFVTVDPYDLIKPNYGEHKKFVFRIFLGRKRQ